jgi:hypothetical protein
MRRAPRRSAPVGVSLVWPRRGWLTARPGVLFFEEFLAGPVFSLTADQDWAPEWALAEMLDLLDASGVPLHLFATNESPLLGRRGRSGQLTLGIHPNFQAGSTHGSDADAVIESCLSLVPDATTFRCHGFVESTRVVWKLAARGFTADSNILSFLQPGLSPIVRGAGGLSFPVFFEDDVFLDLGGPELDLSQCLDLLWSPGLKILNFHPSLVGLNAPSVDYYDAHRTALFGSGARPQRHDGRGVATMLSELVSAVHDRGFHFTPYPQLVADAYRTLENAVPHGLYRWPGTPSTS